MFASNEYIIAVSGASGVYVDSLTFITNLRTYGPFGGPGGGPFKLNGNVYGIYAAVAPTELRYPIIQAIGFYY